MKVLLGFGSAMSWWKNKVYFGVSSDDQSSIRRFMLNLLFGREKKEQDHIFWTLLFIEVYQCKSTWWNLFFKGKYKEKKSNVNYLASVWISTEKTNNILLTEII